MIYETYQSSTSRGLIEFGFCFKKDAETEDSEFDLVLGVVTDSTPGGEQIVKEAWEDNKWAAEAICRAYKGVA